MIILTFDTDWIPENILDDILLDLKEKNIKATIFASNYYRCLVKPPSNIEVGIHPNFDRGNWMSQTVKIKKIYPKSIGVRNHSLVFSERLRPIWRRLGIKYTSNSIQFLQNGIHPVPVTKNIIDFPLFHMDRFYLEMTEPKTDFGLKKFSLGKPGLKIFDFHPIHLTLNTPSQKYYEKHKINYKNIFKLKKTTYKGRGTRTLYDNLIRYIIKNNIKTHTLNELHEKF